MEKIIEVIKLIADKYRDKVNASISEDALIIEYLYERASILDKTV